MINNLKVINKKGFLTRNFIAAGILFSGMVALFVLMIGGISDEYDSTLLTNEDFAANYDTLVEQTNRIETAREASAAGDGLSFLGNFDVAFQSTFTVFQMIFQTLDLFGGMSDGFSEDFGVDPSVVRITFLIALSLLTMYIVWNIISSISRGKI